VIASCQFGQRADFALEWSPAPSGDRDHQHAPSWGSLRVWVQNQCLTEAFLPGEPGQPFVPEPLTWDMRSLAEWLGRYASISLQEEAFPFGLLDEVPHAAAWLTESMRFARAQTPQDEDRLWRQRSEWRDRHAPSRALLGAATPQWTLRRVGDRIELTWDTAPALAIRPDIGWMGRPQGQVLLDGPSTSAVLGQFADHLLQHQVVATADAIPGTVSTSAWRWLVSPAVRGVADAVPALADQISASVQQANPQQSGWWWAHSLETWLLRNLPTDAPGTHQNAVERLLALTTRPVLWN
jgi:hypothetical protein